jgi:hypothetical protein
MLIFQNEMQNIHLNKLINIQQRLTKKDLLRHLKVFLVICCKHFYSKIPFHEKIKMTIGRPIVLGSFVMVGSFDCDLTLLWEK